MYRFSFSFLIAFLLLVSNIGVSQDALPYQFYTGKGKKADFKKFIAGAKEADVVLFGELHNNAMVHWLQLQTLKALDKRWEGDLSVGAEMFERDDQLILDEYLNGTIEKKHLVKEAKLWPNFQTDYQPLLEYCKENNIGFFASNVPRRYAAVVAREGLLFLESLSVEAKQYMAPLPLKIDSADAGYQEMMQMDMGHDMGAMKQLFVEAQALKDATMAFSIAGALKEKEHVLHFNGDFHSKNYSGIYRFVKQHEPEARIVTVAVVESDPQTFKESYKALADFVILVPEDMAKSH